MHTPILVKLALRGGSLAAVVLLFRVGLSPLCHLVLLVFFVGRLVSRCSRVRLSDTPRVLILLSCSGSPARPPLVFVFLRQTNENNKR